ncbi:MAG: large conductance mechanosensitive channel protein MscL [Actinomycetia bacterium]|nr:large conductance mechanosensitive channel protein MscL [Actinomycetes bacterium]
MGNLIKEFREFIDKGGVFEAAVGLIMALAFTPVVNSLVDDIIMQIVAAVFGQPNFGGLSFGLGDAEIYYGRFINTVITFVAIAAVIFMLVKTYNATKDKSEAGAGPSEVDLLTEIRDNLAAR